MEFNLRRYNFDFIYNDNLNRPKYRLKIESTNFKVSLQLGARYHHRMRPSVYFFVLFRFGVFSERLSSNNFTGFEFLHII